MKLYEKKFGCVPPDSPKQVASGAAPGAPSNLHSAKPKKDDEISDDYDDDFDDLLDEKPKIGAKVKDDDSSERKREDLAHDDDDKDDWELGDDDWGDLDDISDNKKGLGPIKTGKPSDDKISADKKR